MKKQLVWVLLFLLMGEWRAVAQSDFRPGYIVLQGGDTVRGQVDYRRDSKTGESCVFISRNSGHKQVYSALQLLGYGFDGGRRFQSFEVESDSILTPVFLEVLFDGRVSLYYLTDATTERYFIRKSGETLLELKYDGRYICIDGIWYFRKSTRHIGILEYCMADAPELFPEIEAIEEPSQESLLPVLKQYHHAVCGDTVCVAYAKKLTRFKVDVELTGGINMARKAIWSDVTNAMAPVVGVHLHIRMPRGNERIYLETGFERILYTFALSTGDFITSSEMVKATYWKIPARAEYIMPRGIIRPFFSAGIMLYVFHSKYGQGMDHTISFSTGVRCRIGKYCSLGISPEVEFVPAKIVLLAPQKLLFFQLRSSIYFHL
jgi:hypothetical protein